MRQILFKNGPVPPEGQEFCPICVMLFRTAIDKHYAEQIGAELREAPDGPPLVYDISEVDAPAPMLAAVYGVSIMPQYGIMKACWGHIVAAQTSMLAPASADQVPLLSGRR